MKSLFDLHSLKAKRMTLQTLDRTLNEEQEQSAVHGLLLRNMAGFVPAKRL
jgi:hypothetical protein